MTIFLELTVRATLSPMNSKNPNRPKLVRAAIAAGLAILCGIALWQMPLGEPWANVSYDYLFRFGARNVTNKIVLVLMDAEAHRKLHQERGKWDRGEHAKLLERLAADGCPLLVLDAFFREERDPETDRALAEALRKLPRVVLQAKQSVGTHVPGLESISPLLPFPLLLNAAMTNWGMGRFLPDDDSCVRKHWPFPAPHEKHFSLSWAAARVAGAELSAIPQEQWLRYYGPNAWTAFSYHFATNKPIGYFRDKIVFIGSKPEDSFPSQEEDKFSTPYTRWTNEAVGGVELVATAFLNLMNGDWLRRPPLWIELLLLVITGAAFGVAFSFFKPLTASLTAAGIAFVVVLAGVSLSYFTNYWFPWMIVAAGQVPCALLISLVFSAIEWRAQIPESSVHGVIIDTTGPDGQTSVIAGSRDVPNAPDYEIFNPPFAEGAYGKVWLARNAIGQWQALKAVYEATFRGNVEPYEREFRGISRYKPVSSEHPGLLRVDFVSMKRAERYFYYVMELGDAAKPGWQEKPASYKPRDLATVRAQAKDKCLPVRECVRTVIPLAEALDFLHKRDLTHRDIKPQNIIFVNGRPKLADVGLVAEIHKDSTLVGTPGYMPPPPEPPGTVQADIYGLGMVLYVISTGSDPHFFPELSTSLIERTSQAEFIRLNPIILKACNPDCAKRYTSAAEMRAALLDLQKALEEQPIEA